MQHEAALHHTSDSRLKGSHELALSDAARDAMPAIAHHRRASVLAVNANLVFAACTVASAASWLNRGAEVFRILGSMVSCTVAGAVSWLGLGLRRLRLQGFRLRFRGCAMAGP